MIDSSFTSLLQIIEHGIFHGIDTYDHRETRANTGFSRVIYNRVGVVFTAEARRRRGDFGTLTNVNACFKGAVLNYHGCIVYT